MQGAGSKKTSGNKTEAAHQSLAVYEAILTHLRAHGGLVNSVKAEYLLDMDDFDRIMDDRTAAAAGNADQEQALELWAPVEQSFGVYSAQAWNAILLQVGVTSQWAQVDACRLLHDLSSALAVYEACMVCPWTASMWLLRGSSMLYMTHLLCMQVFRMYVLAKITPAALRQLLEATVTASTTDTGKAAGAAPKANAGTVIKPVSAGQSATATASSAPDAAAAAATANALQVPDDEMFASSNIFSVPETCLLTWMSVHMAKAFPQKVRLTYAGSVAWPRHFRCMAHCALASSLRGLATA